MKAKLSLTTLAVAISGDRNQSANWAGLAAQKSQAPSESSANHNWWTLGLAKLQGTEASTVMYSFDLVDADGVSHVDIIGSTVHPVHTVQ